MLFCGFVFGDRAKADLARLAVTDVNACLYSEAREKWLLEILAIYRRFNVRANGTRRETRLDSPDSLLIRPGRLIRPA